MNGNTERAQCGISRVRIPQEKEKRGNEKNKTKNIKYLKRVKKKKKKKNIIALPIKIKCFKIHFWVYKVPHNSFQLHFLRVSNGSSEREKTVVRSEYFDAELFKSASSLSSQILYWYPKTPTDL